MKKIIVGNWKMHGFVTMAHPIVEVVLNEAKQRFDSVEVVLCPPFTLITRMAEWLAGTVIKIGAQDCHSETHGAFTGNVSATMLMDADCSHVIVGHSERRNQQRETNEDVRRKADAAMKAGLIPIICIGESEEERASGKAEAVIARQLAESLPNPQSLTPNPYFLLAYEPVWAIGSGKTPSADDIRQMHAYIQSVAAKRTGLAPEQIHVLYGGSVKAANAGEIMAIEGVAGVLVGGASLNADEFCQIIRSAV